MAEYNKLTPELIEELKGIVGEANCYVGDDISADYSHDEMPIYGEQMPEAVCLPASTAEVAAIMMLCTTISLLRYEALAPAWLVAQHLCLVAWYCAPCVWIKFCTMT